jgi:hypothetical protein
MFSKEEAKIKKIEFWQSLNEKLEMEKGVHGNKVNWTSFNTEIKHLYFRMEADEKVARLCIDMQFPNAGIREIYFEQFTELKNKLDEAFDSKLIWLPTHAHWNGKTIARICVEESGVNILNEPDWGKMQSFLVHNFVKLEAFWAEFGDIFKNLK